MKINFKKTLNEKDLRISELINGKISLSSVLKQCLSQWNYNKINCNWEAITDNPCNHMKNIITISENEVQKLIQHDIDGNIYKNKITGEYLFISYFENVNEELYDIKDVQLL